MVDNLLLVEGWKVVELEDVADAEQRSIEEIFLDAARLKLFYLVLVFLFLRQLLHSLMFCHDIC